MKNCLESHPSPAPIQTVLGEASTIHSTTPDAGMGPGERPVPQPSQWQRLGSLDRPLLVSTTLINCHLRRPWDQLFRHRPARLTLEVAVSCQLFCSCQEYVSWQSVGANKPIWSLKCCRVDASSGVACEEGCTVSLSEMAWWAVRKVWIQACESMWFAWKVEAALFKWVLSPLLLSLSLNS